MARHKLTDTRIRAAKAGWHGDGDGLWLRVSRAGARSWVFVIIRDGRRREMGLGAYGSGSRPVSLALAREKADAVREILARGGDPFRELPERKAKATHRTFGECAAEVVEQKARTLRNAKSVDQWRMTLNVYAKPLHRLSVDAVATDDVVRVLRPLWEGKNETAARLRGRIESVLDYAKALGLREGENPARWKGHLDHILGKRQRLTRGHFAAMPYAAVPGFMEQLRDVDGFGARALELCILSATRSGEILKASWEEMDLNGALWTIPAARMKAGKEHIVPLSSRALTVLEGLQEKRLSQWVFPGHSRKKHLSNMSMTAVMRRLGHGEYTVHGFRSSFRDWAGDATSFPRDLAEMALAHKVGDEVEQAYRRGAAIQKRRKLMEAWARYLESPRRGEVLSIHGAQT